jgi:hypothetical protein
MTDDRYVSVDDRDGAAAADQMLDPAVYIDVFRR